MGLEKVELVEHWGLPWEQGQHQDKWQGQVERGVGGTLAGTEGATQG